jgi:hypothetical protein
VSRRAILFLLLILATGLTGCRRPIGDRAASNEAKSTGPLTQQAAEQEALQAVLKEAGSDHTCSIASVKSNSDVYEVCVRIDPPPSGKKQLPEHWTVEIPKCGVTRGTDTGGG